MGDIFNPGWQTIDSVTSRENKRDLIISTGIYTLLKNVGQKYLDFGIMGYRLLTPLGWNCDLEHAICILLHWVRREVPTVCITR